MSADQSTGAGESCEQKPKVKHDWYQNDAYVTVNVLIKNLEKGQVNVVFEEKSLAIHLLSDILFSVNLLKEIVPSKCSYRITPTKVELKLKKHNEESWSNLEAQKDVQQKDTPKPLTKPNWDQFVQSELKDDAAQGEAALNELFQKIYSEGSDEVKKAMNKSFLESGGTVLSTNWNEVGEKKVDIKPPDGMEWKKWDEL